MSNQNARMSPSTVIDIISRDRNGNVTEHLRIHPDGTEEVITRQP